MNVTFPIPRGKYIAHLTPTSSWNSNASGILVRRYRFAHCPLGLVAYHNEGLLGQPHVRLAKTGIVILRNARGAHGVEFLPAAQSFELSIRRDALRLRCYDPLFSEPWAVRLPLKKWECQYTSSSHLHKSGVRVLLPVALRTTRFHILMVS